MRRLPRKHEINFGRQSVRVGEHQHQTPQLTAAFAVDGDFPGINILLAGSTYSKIDMRLKLWLNTTEARKLISTLESFLNYIEEERTPEGRYQNWQ